MPRTVPAGGFTYVWMLVAVAVMATGLAAIGEVAGTVAKREKEAELLFVGDQIAQAIIAYRASSPGAAQYPRTLEDLLADKRYPNLRRYLRRVYPDPMTGRPDWGLVRLANGGIVGVYSRSTEQPVKTANFPAGYEAFMNAKSYAEWRFVTVAGALYEISPPGATPAAALGGAPPALGVTPAPQRPAVRVARPPWVCNAQRGADLRSCDSGDATAQEACRQSAARRHRECLAGGDAGPLVVK